MASSRKSSLRQGWVCGGDLDVQGFKSAVIWQNDLEQRRHVVAGRRLVEGHTEDAGGYAAQVVAGTLSVSARVSARAPRSRWTVSKNCRVSTVTPARLSPSANMAAKR